MATSYAGSKSLGTFYGYADGSRYGKYSSCVLSWTDVVRKGKNVTVKGLRLKMTPEGTGWTTYRFACKGTLTGNTVNTYANNYTLKPYDTSTDSVTPIDVTFGDKTLECMGTTVSCYIEIASTKGSTSWKNFASTNLKVTFNISCPPANPNYTAVPSIVSYDEISVVINRGTTDIESIYQYYDSGSSQWKDINNATITFNALTPGQPYTYKFRALNKLDTTFASEEKSVSVTTYKYPYLQSKEKEHLLAGEKQTLSIYNPLGRNLKIDVKNANKEVMYSSETNQKSYTFELINDTACQFIGESNLTGKIYYECKYADKDATSLEGTYEIDVKASAPVWNNTRTEEFIHYKDGNATGSVLVTGNSAILVQQHSKLFYGLQYANTESAPQEYGARSDHGSVIDKYQISINGGEFIDIANSSEEANIDAKYTIPSNASSISLRVKAVDKRKLETPIIERDIPVTQYTPPQGSVYAAREGGYGDVILLGISPIWSVNQINNAGRATIVATQDGQAIDLEEQSTVETFSDAVRLENKSNDSRFTFKVTLTDAFGSSTELEEVSVGIGQPILFIDSEQVGVGINCFPEGKGLYVNGETHLMGDVEVHQSAIIDEFLIVGNHRCQHFTRDNEKRTGWYYTGGE